MANETKFEIKGNFFVVTNVTTRQEYIREIPSKVKYRRDENDVFTFYQNIEFPRSIQREYILGYTNNTQTEEGRTSYTFGDTQDENGVLFTSADALDNWLSVRLGSSSNGCSLNKQGFIDYNDSTGAISITANTWTDIPNDGAGALTNKLYRPEGVTELMDVGTGYIDATELELGDGIIVSNRYIINPNTNNSLLEFRYQLGTGGNIYNRLKYMGRLDSGSNKDYEYDLTTDLINMDSTNTKDNPIKLQIRLSTNATLTNAGSVIQLIKRKI